MSSINLPQPTILDTFDRTSIESIIPPLNFLYTGTDSATFFYHSDVDPSTRQLYSFLGSLTPLVKDTVGLAEGEELVLDRVMIRQDEVKEGDIIIPSATGWHADEPGFDSHTVLIQSMPTAEYVFGLVNPNWLRKVLGYKPIDKMSKYGLMTIIGVHSSELSDEEILDLGLQITQPVGYAAHLLTREHIHRSPVGLSKESGRRTHMNLRFSQIKSS